MVDIFSNKKRKKKLVYLVFLTRQDLFYCSIIHFKKYFYVCFIWNEFIERRNGASLVDFCPE